jgi:hypothetical protein
MNIEELEKTISLTRDRIKKTNSYKLKNDLGKYLKKLIKERNDYYRFRGCGNG